MKIRLMEFLKFILTNWRTSLLGLVALIATALWMSKQITKPDFLAIRPDRPKTVNSYQSAVISREFAMLNTGSNFSNKRRSLSCTAHCLLITAHCLLITAH
jgi:hypothetical protein